MNAPPENFVAPRKILKIEILRKFAKITMILHVWCAASKKFSDIKNVSVKKVFSAPLTNKVSPYILL